MYYYYHLKNRMLHAYVKWERQLSHSTNRTIGFLQILRKHLFDTIIYLSRHVAARWSPPTETSSFRHGVSCRLLRAVVGKSALKRPGPPFTQCQVTPPVVLVVIVSTAITQWSRIREDGTRDPHRIDPFRKAHRAEYIKGLSRKCTAAAPRRCDRSVMTAMIESRQDTVSRVIS